MKGEKYINTLANTGNDLNYKVIKVVQNSIKSALLKKNKNILDIVNILHESPTIYNKSVHKLLSKNKKMKNINTYINGIPNICLKSEKCLYGLRTTAHILESLKYKKKK